MLGQSAKGYIELHQKYHCWPISGTILQLSPGQCRAIIAIRDALSKHTTFLRLPPLCQQSSMASGTNQKGLGLVCLSKNMKNLKVFVLRFGLCLSKIRQRQKIRDFVQSHHKEKNYLFVNVLQSPNSKY